MNLIQQHFYRLFFACLVAGAICSSCTPKLESISARDPGMFEKVETGPLEGRSRPVEPERGVPELYVKHREIVATPAKRNAGTGSLYSADDDRNMLFVATTPKIGAVLNIEVTSNRAEAPAKQQSKQPKSPSDNKATASEPGNKEKSDGFEEELIKAMPDLAPADKNPALLRQFNVEVTGISDNGDMNVVYKRRSLLDDQAAEIRFRARIPYSRLVESQLEGRALNTNDLATVSWVESHDGAVAERISANWEDEYTMRLSGFDEAKSRSALALEEKRKQLLDVRNRLDTRIQTFAEERRQFAKQREDLLAKEQENKQELTKLQETVDEQKSELERLKPAEEPETKTGDQKDGKNGKK